MIPRVTLARLGALRDTSGVRWKMKHVAQPLALAAFFAAQLGSVFHLGLVRHEVCEEHGELVDVTEDDRDTTHGDSQTPKADRHEHCPLLVHNAHAVTAAPIELVRPVLFASVAEANARLVADTEPSLSVLDVAPKTSPPG